MAYCGFKLSPSEALRGRPRSAYLRRAFRAAFHTILLTFLSLPAVAQTVRPVVVEFKEKARAKFELVNDTLFPLNVVLEPRSFSLSLDGQPTFRALDNHIHLRLSSMSFRLPPQQTRLVFYEASADKLPAWFVIYCTFAGFPQQSGLGIQVELPHTVYLLQKKQLEESDIAVRILESRPDRREILIEVENVSPRLGRVLAIELRSAREKRESHVSFPLLPTSRRQMAIPWEAGEPPDRVIIRFAGFTVEKMMSRH